MGVLTSGGAGALTSGGVLTSGVLLTSGGAD